jgi:hypothetical protein
MAGRVADDRADAVAAAKDELYGLPLGQFTMARAERAKRTRADGDREAAAVIAKLPKPNVVAWLANQLARREPGQLRPLLELGESLRQATADLDAARLGQLSRQQREVVSALTGRARELATEAGQAVSDSTVRGLEDTLHAALADEQAAQELTRGQLAAGLSRTGFPGLDAAADEADMAAAWAVPAQKQARPAASAKRGTAERSGSSAASRKQTRADGSSREAAAARPDRPSPDNRTAQRTRKAAADRRAEAARAAAEARRQQLERARRAEADASGEADEAGREQDRARTALTDAESAARQAEETISRLQDELDAALDARNNAGRTQRQARKDADRADRTARQAERRLTEATARREELERDA